MATDAIVLSATCALVLCTVGATSSYRRWVIPWEKRRAWQRLWDERTHPGEPLVL